MHRKEKSLSTAMIAVALLLASLPSGGVQRELTNTRLTVQVRNESGNPLRGVSRVRLERVDGVLVEESDTDPEGQIHFGALPRERLVVIVRREGYVTARMPLGPRQSQRDIYVAVTLQRQATLKEKAGEQSRVDVDYLALPPKARRDYDKGIEQARKGNYERAARYFERVARLCPESPGAWNELGSAYLRSKEYGLAENAFRKAIETKKDFAPPLFNLGLIYNSQKRFVDAEALLRRFTELDATRWQGFVELSDAHYGLGKFAEAENDLKRVVELNPRPPAEIHVKLANIYVAGRQFSKALVELETYLQQNPNGPLAARVREVMARMKADGVTPNHP